jgi:hypothetical protein
VSSHFDLTPQDGPRQALSRTLPGSLWRDSQGLSQDLACPKSRYVATYTNLLMQTYFLSFQLVSDIHLSDRPRAALQC